MGNNSFFQFKQFTINQSDCAMKVGTDGVLLGSWTEIKSANYILDIGTGTGLIALMLAQKSSAQINAIEINELAGKQAAENFATSPWNKRVQVHICSFQDFFISSTEKYDLIVSNPPYFSESLKNPSESRCLARHNDELSQQDLLIGVQQLLRKTGRFCVIFPVKEGNNFIDLAEKNNLFCTKKTNVYSNFNTSIKRLLIEFSPTPSDVPLINNLVIETGERHSYTEQYKTLTKDFYLNF